MQKHRTSVAIVWAMLMVGIAACDELTSDFIPRNFEVSPKEIINLTRARAPGTLQANGITTDTLIAHISLKATSRTVTFTTSGGTFEISGVREVKVRAESPLPDAEHLQAKAILRTDTIAARVFVRASVGDFSDTVEIVFVRP